MNSDFLNAAFSAEEQAAISDTTVINGVDSYTGKDFGNDTVDKVFLLSVEECMKYFRGDSNIDSYFYFAILNDISECKGPTRYAATNDVRSGWWGRSSEPDSTKAIYVNSYDALDLNVTVTEEKQGVRPAIWVDKEAVSYTIDDGKVHVDVNDLDHKCDCADYGVRITDAGYVFMLDWLSSFSLIATLYCNTLLPLFFLKDKRDIMFVIKTVYEASGELCKKYENEANSFIGKNTLKKDYYLPLIDDKRVTYKERVKELHTRHLNLYKDYLKNNYQLLNITRFDMIELTEEGGFISKYISLYHSWNTEDSECF